jgi:hypothetical protein
MLNRMTTNFEPLRQIDNLLLIHHFIFTVCFWNVKSAFNVVFLEQVRQPGIRRIAIVPACCDEFHFTLRLVDVCFSLQ